MQHRGGGVTDDCTVLQLRSSREDQLSMLLRMGAFGGPRRGANCREVPLSGDERSMSGR